MLDKLRLDHAGVAEMLRSAGVQSAVAALANEVNDSVGSMVDGDVDTVVDEYTTDRAAASVTIRDARGRLLQARDGVLTRAAASAGLEVTEKG